jgi:hypothetical protein
MNQELPPLPELPVNEVIPYSAIRYVAGYSKSFIHEYAFAYAESARAPLLARVAELEGIVEKLTDSECDKIMAMSDAQISALHRMEGHDPEDIAKLGQMAAQLAIRDVRVAELEAEVARLREDATRYRLVRRGQRWSVIDGIGNVLRGEQLDAAVDAALTTPKQETPT